MLSNHNRRRLWLLAAMSLLVTTLAGTPLSDSSNAAPAVRALRQDEGTLEPRGHFFGWMAAAAVSPTDSDHVYLGEGSGFTVLDVSDPSDPQSMGGISLGQGDVSDIVAIGATAFALNGDGLRAVDVSDPDEPTLMGSVGLTGTMGSLAVTGSVAYVTRAIDWTDGWLYAVDVSDPEQPHLLASYDTPGTANDVTAVTDTIYLADGDSLLVLDMSDPHHPKELSTYEPPEPIQAVQAISTTAYLLTQGEFPVAGGHLRIVDLSDPASPDPLGSYDALEGGKDLHVVNETAYVADDDGVLQVLDVSEPYDPQPLAAHNVGETISGVVVSGDHAHVRGEHGIHILDISDPENPDALGSHERPSAVMDVIVDHPTGYIAGYDKLWTIDMSDPVLPIPVGSAPLQDVVGEEKQLALAPHPQTGDPLVYVAERLYGLEIFSVTHPTSPTAIGEYPVPGGHEMNDACALGDYAYALTEAGGDGRLHVLDVSDPSAPDETDSYDTAGDARQIVVTELVTGTRGSGAASAPRTVAFVADGETGLQIIDVSDPDDVTELNHIDPPVGGTTDLVAVVDGWAYVGSNTDTTWHVQVFDVTDLLSPTLLGEQQAMGRVNDLDVDDDYIYVAVTDDDLTTSARPLWDPLWPADDDLEVEVGVHVFTGGRYWSTTGYESDYWGGYQTDDADSVHRYVANVMGYQVRFTFIDKATFGAEVNEVVGDETPGDCAIDARIEPAKAEADGCTLSPLGRQPCDCGSDEEIAFEHEAVNGWEWDGLNPDPVTCPEAGTRSVIGQFAPFVTLGGGAASSFLCMSDEPPPVEERTQTAFWFSLQASEADTWELTSLTFQASGDGDDAANVEEVRLYHGSTPIGTGTFSGDDGTVTFEFPTIIIATTPQTFRLDYVFDYDGFEACGTEAKQFDVTVSNLPSGLEPQTYKPGHYSGGASGSVTVGCIVHEETQEGFDTIQEAVDAASEGTTISLCPGTYEENVDVEASMTIQSKEGHEETVVQAADANDHVFHVKQNATTIKGLTIEGASGTDRAGVYIGGSTVREVRVNPLTVSSLTTQDASIQDNYIADNRYGIYLHEAQRTEIKKNYVSGNSGSGLRLKSSTQSRIEGNSIYLNDEDGIYIEACQDTVGQETTITQNSVTRNDRHGIHLKQSSGIEIENNVSLSENKQHGVFLEGSEDVRIADNPILKENGKDGISLESSTGVEIEGNPRIEENAEKGISLYNCQSTGGGDPNRILGNTISGNRPQGRQAVGIYLDSSTGVMIGSREKPNTIRTHTSYGVSLVNGADDNAVSGNRVESNDEAGVYIEASCKNTVDQNTLGPENGHGVRIEASQCAAGQPNILTSNTIEENAEHGIHLASSYGNQIGMKDKGNTVRSNDGSGIALRGCEAPSGQENHIEANTVQDNAKHGIHLEDSRRNAVTDGNDISENGEDGVYLLSSDASVISGNIIHGEGRQKNGITIGHTGDYADPTEITDNTIQDHRENGIRLYGACKTYVGFTVDSPTTVKKNIIGPSNEESGIRVEYCTCSGGNENVIGGNQIHRNPYGIIVANSAGTRVEKVQDVMNEIEENDKGGIYLTKSSRIELVGNFLKGNDGAGVHLVTCEAEAGQENEIRENVIRENSGHGIHLERTRGTKIGAPGSGVNTIRLNTGNGIHLEQCTAATDGGQPLNTIINNTIKDDNNHGIYLIGSRFNLIQDNEVRANYKNGIHLKGSSFNQIYGNEDVAENKWYGIYLSHNSQENDIAGNHVLDNRMAGIFLKEAHRNYIPKKKGERNVIEKNDEDGIRIDGGHENIIRNNTIQANERDGIRLSNANYNEVRGAITIQNNEGHGIYLEHSQANRLEGPAWMDVGVIAPDFVDYQAVIRDNDDYGIVFRDRSGGNRLARYAVAGHSVCMRIDNSSRILFEDDLFFSCTLGVRETNGYDNAYTLQRFEACHAPYRGLIQGLTDPDGLGREIWPGAGKASPNVEDGTALLLENSDPQIEGCSFFDNEGDGIRTERGAKPVIRRSNIYSNDGLGLNNLDPSVTVSARENWWGAPSGPGGDGQGDGDEVSGSVDFTDWRPITVTLVAVAREDLVLAARGAAASNRIRVRNWQTPTDTITVTLADAEGWLMEPGTFTLTLDADTTMPVSFTVPSAVDIGTTDSVSVTVASQADPVAMDTATFQVAAIPVADLLLRQEIPDSVEGQMIAHTIVVTNSGPDGATSVTITDTLPITATVMSIVPSQGSCSEKSGVVNCDVGRLASGAQARVDLTVRTRDDQGLYTEAEVGAVEHDPDPSNNFSAAYTMVEPSSAQIFLPLVLRTNTP